MWDSLIGAKVVPTTWGYKCIFENLVKAVGSIPREMHRCTFSYNFRASVDLAKVQPWTSHCPPRICYNSKLGPKGRSASSAEHPKNKRKQDKAKRKPYIMTRFSRFLSASISIVLSKRLQESFAECQTFSNIQLRRRAMSLLKPEHG